MLSDVLVVFDHLKHTVTVLANVYADDPAGIDAAYAGRATAIADVRARLAGPVPRPARPPAADRAMPVLREQHERAAVRGRWSRASSSTCTPATPSRSCPRSAGRPPSPVEPFSIYRGLRAVNPSPYMYFLDFGDFQVVGASPEPLLTVAGGRSRPARSPARGRAAPTPRTTRASPPSCSADPKERAEHVMLVDLGRNDLGRVCEYGTVEVATFMDVERYTHVMHIVSRSRGGCARRSTRSTRCAPCFPAGTLSGRAEGPGDADHRRAGAGQARRLRRRDRLSVLRGRPRHVHPHPHGRRQGRHGPRPGRRRDGGRRQARLRVRGVGGQGARRCCRAIELAIGQPDWRHEGPRRRQLRLVHLQPRPVPG